MTNFSHSKCINSGSFINLKTSDFPGCNYVSKKPTAIVLHKRMRHVTKSSTVKHVGVHTGQSTTSTDIVNKHVVSCEETITVSSKTSRYMCDVIDCVSVHNTARGLAIHKSRRHAKRVQTEDTMTVKSDSVSAGTVDSTTSSARYG